MPKELRCADNGFEQLCKAKILELKIILNTSKRKICNEKKVFLVFAFYSDELGAGFCRFFHSTM